MVLRSSEFPLLFSPLFLPPPVSIMSLFLFLPSERLRARRLPVSRVTTRKHLFLGEMSHRHSWSCVYISRKRSAIKSVLKEKGKDVSYRASEK